MRLRQVCVLLLLFGMVWLARADQPAVDESELNRLQLEKWKKDAAHYARLKRNLTEFLNLPSERQEALRQFDRALQEEDSATSARLQRTLDRYVDWLQGLPQEDRNAVVNSNSDIERLEHIKQIRIREWILHQPKAVQEELKHLPPGEQAARIAQLRQREAEFRKRWELTLAYTDVAIKFRNQPEKLSDDLQFFIKNSLEPQLSADEKKQLAGLKDKWPLFEMKLVELTDKHPVKLPGPTTGVKTLKDLPPELVKGFPALKNKPTPQMIAMEGRWPEYAEAVTVHVNNVSRNRKITEPHIQLGICKSADFAEPVRTFIQKELKPALKPAEAATLQQAEGSWPSYPRTLQRLAKSHNLAVPGMTLPGTRDLWEPFRRKSAARRDVLPEVPDQTLLDFANRELTAEERAALPAMSLHDPLSREEWKRAYFMRHPEALKQLRNQDVRNAQATKRS